MNLNQIVNMVMRLLMRKGMNWGINKGTQARGRRGTSTPRQTSTSHAPGDQTHSTQAREAAKRARKAAAITRRLGR